VNNEDDEKGEREMVTDLARRSSPEFARRYAQHPSIAGDAAENKLFEAERARRARDIYASFEIEDLVPPTMKWGPPNTMAYTAGEVQVSLGEHYRRALRQQHQVSMDRGEVQSELLPELPPAPRPWLRWLLYLFVLAFVAFVIWSSV
jgi:hypothetical protein